MVVQTLFWVALPGIVYGLLALWLESDPPRRPRRAPDRAPLTRVVAQRVAGGRHQPPEPDPFAVLRLQVRLGVVAAQLRALEGDPTVWARARRLEATRAAYDDLLAEACRLAGVPVPERTGLRRDEPERFREEMELASRGWSW